MTRKVLNLLKIKYKNCLECNNEFITTGYHMKFCSIECRKKYRNKYMKNRKFEYDKVKIWRINNKKLSIEYKGGKCIVCDYNRCSSALEFHHIDSNEKDFSISHRNISFNNLKKELNKCVLICSNCHREVHDNIIDINNYLYKNINNDKVIRINKIRKKRKKEKKNTIKESQIKQRKVVRPSYEQLVNEINELGYCGVGRKYGVSDNSIRKWKKYYEK